MPDISVGDSYTQSTSTNAPVETALLKTGPGVLYALTLTNTSASDRFVFVFDATTASGDLLMAPVPVLATRRESIELRYPVTANNGVFVAVSSTLASFTASGTADVYVRATVK